MPPGTDCPAGGQQFQVGIDVNGDGVLESSEIQQTAFVCDGTQGDAGPPGPAGPPGTTADTPAPTPVESLIGALPTGVDGFVNFEGLPGGFTGGSIADGFVGWSDLVGFGLSLTIPVDATRHVEIGSPSGGSRSVLSSSTRGRLESLNATGVTIPTVEFELHKKDSDTDSVFFHVTLTNAIISSITQGSTVGGSDARPLVSLALVFDDIKIQVFPQGPDGTPARSRDRRMERRHWG